MSRPRDAISEPERRSGRDKGIWPFIFQVCYLSNKYFDIPRRFLASKCYAKHERPTFTLKTGTIFEDSPTALEKQLTAVWLIVTCNNGISSYKIVRDLGSLRNPL